MRGHNSGFWHLVAIWVSVNGWDIILVLVVLLCAGKDTQAVMPVETSKTLNHMSVTYHECVVDWGLM